LFSVRTEGTRKSERRSKDRERAKFVRDREC
jgi:hypothetical protein